MSLLSGIVAVVKSAIGVPSLLPRGIKRATAKLLTFGLKGLGFDVGTIKRQAVTMFEETASKDMIRLIEGAAERADLMDGIGSFPSDIRFSRSQMFETDFSNSRKYRYVSYVNLTDQDTGEKVFKWISFYSDDSLTKDEIANWYEENVMNRDYEGTFTLDGYNVYEVWHNKKMKY